jgi:hypothetical protein
VTQNDMVMDFCFDEDEVEDEEPATMELVRPRAHSRPFPVGADNTFPVRASPFLHDVPIRSLQYGPPSIISSDFQDHYAYPDGSHNLAAVQPHTAATLQVHDMLTGQLHDTSRRSFLFNPTTEFAAGPPPSAMYHRPSPWSQSRSPSTTAATTTTMPEASSPLFAYAPAHHHTHQHQKGRDEDE